MARKCIIINGGAQMALGGAARLVASAQ